MMVGLRGEQRPWVRSVPRLPTNSGRPSNEPWPVRPCRPGHGIPSARTAPVGPTPTLGCLTRGGGDPKMSPRYGTVHTGMHRALGNGTHQPCSPRKSRRTMAQDRVATYARAEAYLNETLAYQAASAVHHLKSNLGLEIEQLHLTVQPDDPHHPGVVHITCTVHSVREKRRCKSTWRSTPGTETAACATARKPRAEIGARLWTPPVRFGHGGQCVDR